MWCDLGGGLGSVSAASLCLSWLVRSGVCVATLLVVLSVCIAFRVPWCFFAPWTCSSWFVIALLRTFGVVLSL
jgi:hypothetical protein